MFNGLKTPPPGKKVDRYKTVPRGNSCALTFKVMRAIEVRDRCVQTPKEFARMRYYKLSRAGWHEGDVTPVEAYTALHQTKKTMI